MKKILMVSIILLAACSSPPEPPQVDWKKKPETINSEMMNYKSTYSVIKSDNVNGKWSKEIRNFKPENRLYDDAVFYAVTHSDRIVVSTSSADGFWIAKDWLIKNGATCVIEYQPVINCLTCRETNLYFSH
ncbi:conjugal transfer protein [Salmonella enterica subsp. enterica serovar Oslo]|nr:conjugal transfer protein [Salmonella enterica subsp. houtenae]EEJ6747241.1 conjugal transfer protein [Salmonella enterica subsp. enterica serovar Oslo]